MDRVKFKFGDTTNIGFVGRAPGLDLVSDLAVRGTSRPLIIFGPTGCGKTAFLRQAIEVLLDFGYSVVYANPLAHLRDGFSRGFWISSDLRKLSPDLLFPSTVQGDELVFYGLDLLYEAVNTLSRRRVAFLGDDIFSATGFSTASRLLEVFTDFLDNVYSSVDSAVVILVYGSTTPGFIGGRGEVRGMWNLGFSDFRNLYSQLPGSKPPLDDAWSVTGGNPGVLEALYRLGWRSDALIRDVASRLGLGELLRRLTPLQRSIVDVAVDDPDFLGSAPEEVPASRRGEARDLVRVLVERKLIIEVPDRDRDRWIDHPPPKRDRALGIGLRYAWHAPAYRDAARAVLESL